MKSSFTRRRAVSLSSLQLRDCTAIALKLKRLRYDVDLSGYEVAEVHTVIGSRKSWDALGNKFWIVNTVPQSPDNQGREPLLVITKGSSTLVLWGDRVYREL